MLAYEYLDTGITSMCLTNHTMEPNPTVGKVPSRGNETGHEGESYGPGEGCWGFEASRATPSGRFSPDAVLWLEEVPGSPSTAALAHAAPKVPDGSPGELGSGGRAAGGPAPLLPYPGRGACGRRDCSG